MGVSCSVPLFLTPLSFPNLVLSAKPLDMPWMMRILIKNTQIKITVEQGVNVACSQPEAPGRWRAQWSLFSDWGSLSPSDLHFLLNDYGLWLIPLFPLIWSQSPQHPSLGWWGDEVWLSLPQNPPPSWGDSVASNSTGLRGQAVSKPAKFKAGFMNPELDFHAVYTTVKLSADSI